MIFLDFPFHLSPLPSLKNENFYFSIKPVLNHPRGVVKNGATFHKRSYSGNKLIIVGPAVNTPNYQSLKGKRSPTPNEWVTVQYMGSSNLSQWMPSS